MAFKYGTTSPTAIKYNGTDLTVLKYGTTAVWGKPYSLSISAGANTSVTVSRTSSPNQGASTGTLSSGSVIYYGDVLKITYSVSSGYKISTSTVNGTTFSSGATFTVTGAISVVTTAVASQSWKTVWTGSKKCDAAFTKYTTNVQVTNVSGFTGMVYGRPTRINFTVGWYEEYNWGGGTYTYNGMNEYDYIYQNKTNTNGSSSDLTMGSSSKTPTYCFYTYELLGDGLIQFSGRKYYDTYNYYTLYDFYIKSIEQYY